MRAKLALIPLVAGLALLGGCATQNGTATASSPAVTTPAGNGVDKLSADEILKKAKEALKAEKAFHVAGKTTEDGDKVDIDFTFSGENVGGSVKSDTFAIEILSISKDLYMKAPDEFWTMLVQDPTALAGLKGKYVKLDGSNPQFASFKEITDTDQLLEPEGTATKGEAKTINGVPAIGLVDDKDKSVLYIATEGKPLPLRVESSDGTAMEFKYEGVTEVKAPAATDVYDLTKLPV